MSTSSRPSTSGSHASSSSESPHTHSKHDDDHRSHSPSESFTSSSSGSSSRLPNPGALLPPLGPPMAGPSGSGSGSSTSSGNAKPGGPILANEILDPELQRYHHHHASPPNPIPEKCLTFCSQSQDNQPICRMFCLRRRRPIASQAEQLARLRPSPSSTSTSPSKDRGDEWSWSPFKALQRRAAPWSFIYVKGTPEGVVGRYMEELEGDDGNRDFGSISRTATELQRRRGHDGWEYLDWGEHGSLLHLPLTSLLSPIISLPDNVARVFSPSMNLLNLYRNSFTDGAQERNLDRLRSEVVNGGAFSIFGKINAHYRKKVDERKAEIVKQRQEREKHREQAEKALTDQKAKLIQEKMEKYEAARREQEE